jgi:hypothetical protein
MKKISIQKRESLYYVTWTRFEVAFADEKSANNMMTALIELLKRNGGLAKLNERKRIYDILNTSPYSDAVKYIEGGLSE